MSEENERFPRMGMKAARNKWPGKHVVQVRIIMPDGAYITVDGPVEKDAANKIFALAAGTKGEGFIP